MGKWTLVIALAFVIGFQTPVKSAAQSDVTLADRPALVSAVRPSYRAVASLTNARGEVVVEVKIDVKGKGVSASASAIMFSAGVANKKRSNAKLVSSHNTGFHIWLSDPCSNRATRNSVGTEDRRGC